MIAYYKGVFLPKDEVCISPDDRGFLFADGIYEVVCCYRGAFFRMAEHMVRLRRGLIEVILHFDGTEARRGIFQELIERNGLSDGCATVYLQITRGVASRKHRFPDASVVTPTVYATASEFIPHTEEQENGIRVILVPETRWARCDIKSVSLLPNVLAHQRAVEAGAAEALLVRDGAVTEGTHSAFAAVYDGEFVTAPVSNYILGSVTRLAVVELCATIGVPVREFPVMEKDLREADELMIMGTTTEITPIVQVETWNVGGGKPGPVTRRLQEAFRKMVGT